MLLLDLSAQEACINILKSGEVEVTSASRSGLYEAHNAPDYKFNNSASATDTKFTHAPNFNTINHKIHGRVIAT